MLANPGAALSAERSETQRRADRCRCGGNGSAGVINDLWYKNAVIYCLSVGTYMDANGDGIGDFQGLMRRLAYRPHRDLADAVPEVALPRRRLRRLGLLRRRSALRHARR